MRWVFLGLFLVLPTVTHAAISISEVAWMGSIDSANHEWIELHNDAGAVDVTGWYLRDGTNLDVELMGVIPGNAYVVLERTSDASAVGTAFLIYTGALVNTGATLQLVRADGTLEDQLSGGEDWGNIGGDNVTKETAQYTSAGWVTAAATPGRGVTPDEVAVAAADETTPTTAKNGGPLLQPVRRPVIELSLPDVSLTLTVNGPEVGYVNQSITLTAVPADIGEHLIDSLQYEWNFGDGSALAAGETVTHAYAYPGTYAVVVSGGYKRQEQVARHEITILPVSVSVTMNQAGDVQVNNDSPYEIDLSGYRVKADSDFTFPPRTVLLPGQTITIPQRQIGQTTQRMVGVYDAAAELVAARLPDAYQTTKSNSVAGEGTAFGYQLPQPTEVMSVAPLVGEFTFAEVSEPEPVLASGLLSVPVAEAAQKQVASVGAAPLSRSERWPYVALAAVLLIATLSVLVAPRRNPDA
ncbi:PKD domain-containing protein [Candidatus Kaiserbacteria bacterium]|nr:PKD domain-containing protein [Candidatus Kaiserbacteria bacterium]MCB9812579.1 PKD domain-containing protein [Candidatus Nomurabacteria bacterium]